MSRKAKSIKNLTVALCGQGIGLIISFISRYVFVNTLGGEYLGLNGLFTNILTVLSLAELGVGEAITYSLYRPLAKNDYDKCKMLMGVYKKLYTIIGVIIIILGFSLTPFLSFFINEPNIVENIEIVYLLFVLNTGVSYFFSYKRNLIIADQNRYIATIFRYSFYSALNVIQIIYLIIFKDYIGFLIFQLIFTVLENICVSAKANRMYPYLKDKRKVELDSKTKNELIKNTKAMLMHRIGGTVVTSTDNILLSKFVGLIQVGMYSNYYLVTNAIYIIFGQLYSSILASVGNLFVGNKREKQYKIFCHIDFLGFCIHSLASVTLACLLNPVIALLFGEQYVFPYNITLIIVINFYIAGMRRSVLTFREAAGLFYKDRWKAIIEALVNLVSSIILVKYFGTFGVFLGTFISSVSVCVWVEPLILFKYSFGRSVWDYFRVYLRYLLFTVLVYAISNALCSLIDMGSIISIVFGLAICLFVFVVSLVIFFGRNESLEYYVALAKGHIKKLASKK